MSWNHRVVRTQREDIVWYAVHEVYYDATGTPDAVTQDAVAPLGESLKELREELAMFRRALREPVLEMADFQRGGKYGKPELKHGRKLPAIPRAAQRAHPNATETK